MQTQTVVWEDAGVVCTSITARSVWVTWPRGTSAGGTRATRLRADDVVVATVGAMP